MAIDFLNPGQRRINIGKARADLARNPSGGSLPSNNQEALEVSRASARDLVWGTIEKNLRNKRDVKQKQLNRAQNKGFLMRSTPESKQTVSDTQKEIEELTKRIFEAANGKPAKVSITQQREQQNSLAKLIAGLFAAQAQEGNVRSGSQTQQNPQSSSTGNSKASSAGERVLTDLDVDAIVKAFDTNPRNKSGLSDKAE